MSDQIDISSDGSQIIISEVVQYNTTSGGPSGGDSFFHNQMSPSNDVTVVHGLNQLGCQMTFLDSANDECEARRHDVDANTTRVWYDSPPMSFTLTFTK